MEANLEEVEVDQQLEAIKMHFGVKDEMFSRGIAFANQILEGANKTQAYMQAFDCEQKKARSCAGEYSRRHWIQELLRYFKPNEETLYVGEIEKIIKCGMGMIEDSRRDDKTKIEAMKALQPYIKQQQQKMEVEHTIAKEMKPADNVMERMQAQIEQLTGAGKMVNQDGEIIDVTEIL